MQVYVLDYGAGNVRSLYNALDTLGINWQLIQTAADILSAPAIIFPGVGAFGNAVHKLEQLGLWDALGEYVLSDRPFLGICIGMQVLFDASEESHGVKGLGVIPGLVQRFPKDLGVAVPHMGWNPVFDRSRKCAERYYFVHSYRVVQDENNKEWVYGSTMYGGCDFVSAVGRGKVFGVQFHPEKSGEQGLQLIRRFLQGDNLLEFKFESAIGLAKRVIACLDVRTNDQGDLVVTKGDQYDVREKQGNVRNMGKPVALAKKYYQDGADELVFLNITSFREHPTSDAPMLELLKKVSKEVFVPLTIGGGIRDYKDSQGRLWTALEVADHYFRGGADKVSIGSDAVFIAEEFYRNNQIGTEKSAIEAISQKYGRQAVVVSIDPKRIWMMNEDDEEKGTPKYHVIPKFCRETKKEGKCWYKCTVSGGREERDIDVVQVAKAVEALGAGEILLNCIDEDGQKQGFDLELISLVRKNVGIPVVASSGAGHASHFVDVFQKVDCEAALAAGIFHRGESSIHEVKNALRNAGIAVRASI